MSDQRCPEDQTSLRATADGSMTCPLCRGSLVDASQLDAKAHEVLTLETREKSGAFARARPCPACHSTMAPWRIGKVDAWVERCPQCEAFWFDRLDWNILQKQRFNVAAAAVYDSMSKKEQAQLAHDLATSHEPADDLSPTHRVLAMLGVPVVTRIERRGTPITTWALAFCILLTFFVLDAQRWGYYAPEDGLLNALSSVFVHFGWIHLLGNLWFLLSFGDGAEQRLRALGTVCVFVGGGVLGAMVQGWVHSDALVGGASGGIEALMGAFFVLQPKAKVAVGFRMFVFQVPLWAFGIFEVLYQVMMTSGGASNVAWTAHLVGLGTGIGVGLLVVLMDRRAEGTVAPAV